MSGNAFETNPAAERNGQGVTRRAGDRTGIEVDDEVVTGESTGHRGA
jgi:hypothetical protein